MLAETTPRASNEAVQAERPAADREFWATVAESEDSGDFEAYLERFPGGVFETPARRRRDELMALADDAAYSKAKSSGTVQSYLAYMHAYPSGRHGDEVRGLHAVADEKERLARRWPPGKRFRDCDDCPDLVVVPAGSFRMGAPLHEAGRYGDEGPVHRVTFGRPFAVGAYEVTREEFERFVDETDYSVVSCSKYDSGTKSWKKRRKKQDWRNPEFRQTGRHPVVCISHIDAQAYVRWLAGKTGQSYRLLSESEWEYAARAGTTTPYHTGTTISEKQANMARKGRYKDRTAPVGTYPANAFGLYDMHGNVWEWVADCRHDNYVGAPDDGSAWLTGECSRRVTRGGSWWDMPRHQRLAVRWSPKRHGSTSVIGFRVARTLD